MLALRLLERALLVAADRPDCHQLRGWRPPRGYPRPPHFDRSGHRQSLPSGIPSSTRISFWRTSATPSECISSSPAWSFRSGYPSTVSANRIAGGPQKGGGQAPPPSITSRFVLFFPQLIAGPQSVLHQAMGKQVAAKRAGRGPVMEWVGAGLLIFAFGLFKKVVVWPTTSRTTPTWPLCQGGHLMMSEAWVKATAYTLQAVFLIFLRLLRHGSRVGADVWFKSCQTDFLVPYAACSVAEFWQRWHITMMRFFTIYLYNPLWLRSRRHLRRFSEHPNAGLEFAATMAFPTLATFLSVGGFGMAQAGPSSALGWYTVLGWSSIRGGRSHVCPHPRACWAGP